MEEGGGVEAAEPYTETRQPESERERERREERERGNKAYSLRGALTHTGTYSHSGAEHNSMGRVLTRATRAHTEDQTSRADFH